MTDRELLELAAKAAGIETSSMPDGILRNVTGMHPYMNIFSAPTWNPLTDDADALRLFCSFPFMTLDTSEFGVTVRERGNKEGRVYAMWTEWIAENNGDKAAATRRAIVRAAAEIASSLSADNQTLA